MYSLPEDLFLLAINEDKGNIHPSTAQHLKLGLAGAVLAQFALDGCLGLTEQERFYTLSHDNLENQYLSGLLDKIHKDHRLRKPSYWLDAFSYHQKIVRKLILENLLIRNSVRVEQKSLVFLTSSRGDWEGKVSDKYWLKLLLRDQVLAEGNPTISSVALLKVARATKLLDLIFTKDERRSAGKFIADFEISKMVLPERASTFLVVLNTLSSASENTV